MKTSLLTSKNPYTSFFSNLLYIGLLLVSGLMWSSADVISDGAPDLYMAPSLTGSPTMMIALENDCASNESTVNLSALHTATVPMGSVLVWSIDNDGSDGLSSTVATPGAVDASGTYYAYYWDDADNSTTHNTGDCYSSGSEVVVTVSPCVMACTGTVTTIEQTSRDAAGDHNSAAQSFTASVSGDLLEVGSGIRKGFFVPTPDLTLKIYDGEGLGGTALHTQTLSVADFPTDANILTMTELSVAVPVIAGNVYTFEYSTTGTFTTEAWNGDPYAGGQIYKNTVADPVQDMRFQVDICESTAACTDPLNYADNCDFDNDGIPNIDDLDDDNDGILDTEECTATAQVTTPDLDLVLLLDGSNSYGATDFTSMLNSTADVIEDATAIPQNGTVRLSVIQFSNAAQVEIPPTIVSSSNAAALATTVRNITFLNGGTRTDLGIDLAVSTINGLSPATTSQIINLVKDGGSTDPGAMFNSVNGAVPAGIEAINVIGIGQLSTDPENVFIATTANGIYTATVDVAAYQAVISQSVTDVTNTYATSTAICDTDNDNIPNQFDLDSDDDGCSDAFEAGATTDQTADFEFTDIAANDANGVSPSVDPTDNGVLNYTPTYAAAADDQTNACPQPCTDPNLYADNCDFDGDGVNNDIDLDDDNDGILDTQEGLVTTPDFISTISANDDVFPVGTTHPILVTIQEGAGGTPDGSNIIFSFPKPTGTTLTFDPAGTTITTVDGISVVDNSLWTSLAPAISPVIALQYNGTFPANGISHIGFSLTMNDPGTVGNLTVNLASSGGETNTDNNVVVISFTEAGTSTGPQSEVGGVPEIVSTSLNTDNTGGPNHLDLDSDGDGCSDAFEAGTITTEVADITVAPFDGSAVGDNGFEDDLETAAESGTYDGTYTYAQATDNTTNACPQPCTDPDLYADNCDFDGDGILNIDDIDDDNDGILDIQEGYIEAGKFMLAAGYTIQQPGSGDVVQSVSSVNWTINGITISGTVSSNAELVLFLEENDPSGTWIDGLFPSTVGRTFPYYTDGPPFADVSADIQSRYGSIVITPTSGGSATTLNINVTAVAAAAEDRNTDGDSVPDRFDLDSDGDGCSDAFEAGTISTEVADITQAPFDGSGIGANGLEDALETVAESGIYDGLYTYSAAIDDEDIACPQSCTDPNLYADNCDFDGDGVNNEDDLDDDNDGVLDIDESFCPASSPNLGTVVANTGSGEIAEYNIETMASTIICTGVGSAFDIAMPADGSVYYLLFSDGTISSVDPSDCQTTTLGDAGGGSYNALSILPDGTLLAGSTTASTGVKRFDPATGISTDWADSSDGLGASSGDFCLVDGFIYFATGSGLQRITVDANYDFISVTTVGSYTGSALGMTISANCKLVYGGANELRVFTDPSMSSDNTQITNNLPGFGSVNGLTSIYEQNGCSTTSCADLDTDLDGTPNRFDLDSDGDGCSDAFEAGVTTDETADFQFANTGQGANGFEDSVEDGAESGNYDGTYTYAQATDNATNACPQPCTDPDLYADNCDFDGDGVDNIDDLDDDNDGILDIDEGEQIEYCSQTGEAVYTELYFGTLTSTSNSGMLESVDGVGYTALFSNVATTIDGTVVDATVTAVEASSPTNITYSPILTNKLSITHPSNTTNGHFNGTIDGSYLKSRIDFFEAGTTTPVDVNFILTFEDLDKASGVREEIYLANTEYASYNLSSPITDILLDETPVPGYTHFSASDSDPSIAGTPAPTAANAGQANYFNVSSIELVTGKWTSNNHTGGVVIMSGNGDLIGPGNCVLVNKTFIPEDSDNDNIPNHFDLDSDGDGCSDAFEAGATTDQTADFEFTDIAANDANGVSPSVDPTDNGVLNYTPTYAAAADDQTNACPQPCTDPDLYAYNCDFDGDGVNNIDDLDDDNDGILDTEECHAVKLADFSSVQVSNPAPGHFIASTIDLDGVGMTIDMLSPLSQFITAPELLPSGSQIGSAVLIFTSSNAFTPPTSEDALSFTINATPTLQLAMTYSFDAPMQEVVLHIANLDASQIRFTDPTKTETLLSGGTEVVYNPITRIIRDIDPTVGSISVQDRDGYFSIRIKNTDGSAFTSFTYIQEANPNQDNTGDGNALYVTGLPEGACADTDIDGIANNFDLDSDNDGCSDAFEAGVTTDETADFQFANTGQGANGFEDSVEDGSESGNYDGTYTYAQATDNATNACPQPCTDPDLYADNCDFDGDGILNRDDIDDDNDGVLDFYEGMDSNTLSFIKDTLIQLDFETTSSGDLITQGALNAGTMGGLIYAANTSDARSGQPANDGAANAGIIQNVNGPDGVLTNVASANEPTLPNLNSMSSFAVFEGVNLYSGSRYTISADYSTGIQYPSGPESNEFGISMGPIGQDPYNDEDIAGTPDAVFVYGTFGLAFPRDPTSSITYGTNPPAFNGWSRQEVTFYIEPASDGNLHLYADTKMWTYDGAGNLNVPDIFTGIDFGLASSYSWLSNTSLWVTADEYVDNVIVTACLPDNDSDGIANQFDLDSDGDGCSDAYEAGATTDQTADFEFTDIAANDANGVSPSVDPTDNGDLNYTPTYAAAADDQTNACPQPCTDPDLYDDNCDFDGDGVNNIDDLDDDNDGVLDDEECLSASNGSFEEPSILGYTGPASIGYTGSGPLTTGDANNDGEIDFVSGFTSVNGWEVLSGSIDIMYDVINASDGSQTVDLFGTSHSTLQQTFDVGAAGTPYSFSIDYSGVYIPADNHTDPEATISIDGNLVTTLTNNNVTTVNTPFVAGQPNLTVGWNTYNYNGTSTGSTVTIRIQSTIEGQWNTSIFIDNFLFEACPDVDNDGIANHLDLDSDGDGCSDAFEAGVTTDETADFQFANTGQGANGFEDSVEDGSESGNYDGTYTYSLATDGVSACCDAGGTAPTLSSAAANNNCPDTTVDLDALHTGTTPTNAALVWSSDNDASDGLSDNVSSPTSTAGTYYAYYYDATNDCYSPASTGVVITFVDCCAAGTTIPNIVLPSGNN